MTYTRLEVQRFTCDVCGEKEEQTVSTEEGNPIEEEQDLIDTLKEKGWIWNAETDQHLCPKCSKIKCRTCLWGKNGQDNCILSNDEHEECINSNRYEEL